MEEQYLISKKVLENHVNWLDQCNAPHNQVKIQIQLLSQSAQKYEPPKEEKKEDNGGN